MPRQIKTHVFNGNKYRIELVPPYKLQHDLGSCEPPDKTDKTIRINNTLDGIEELETLIHESTHAALFLIDEPTVEKFAKDLASFLWRWKYRKVQ